MTTQIYNNIISNTPIDDNQVERLLIFGGSFDPYHIGHHEILKQAIKELNIQKVIIVPNKKNPLKNDMPSVNGLERINIIKQIYSNVNILISAFEINSDSESYTINTIDYFQEIYKNAQIYFLIGQDSLFYFDQWKSYDEILKKVKLVVANRKYETKQKVPITNQNIIFINNRNINISASDLRKYLDPNFLPTPILEYINKNAIYATTILKKYMGTKRLGHSFNVANMAYELANIYDKNIAYKAYIAGIYHDIAKEMPNDLLKDIAYNLLDINEPILQLLHPYVSSYIVKTQFNIKDQLILDAIARHTKPYDYYSNTPSLLDMIIYCSDKLEPSRTEQDVPNIEYFRSLVKTNLPKCFVELYDTIQNYFFKG